MVELVALHHLREEVGHPFEQVLLLVDVEGGGAPQRQDRAWASGRATGRRLAAGRLARPGRTRPARAHAPRHGSAPATPPGASCGSRNGPIRVRTRRTTGCPTASHMRRTCRFRPSWIVSRTTAGSRSDDLRRCRRAVVELDALAEPPQRSPGRAALDLGHVLLLDPEARVGHPVGQRPVVGQQQQPFGVAGRGGRRDGPGDRDGTSSITVGRPWGSSAVVTPRPAC